MLSASRAATMIDLSEPVIVHSKAASDVEKLAARELLRYLYRGSGKLGAVASDDAAPRWSRRVPAERARVLLDVAGSNRLAAEVEKQQGIAVDVASLGEEGFRWKATQCQGRPALLIAAARPVGVLRGVYALLERLGFGFYLGGDTFPPQGTPLAVDSTLDEAHKPVFAIRGALPWGNLPNSWWDLEDLKYLYDQLSKQGFNFVGFHQYDHEPFCAYEWQGKLVGGGPFLSSLEKHLGGTPMRTADFGFGTGEYFDRDPFTSRTRLDGKDRDDQTRRAIGMLAESFRYAHARGLKVCLGFELWGDPTDAGVQAHLEARIAALLKHYPMLDYIWFFQSESLGLVGWEVPKGSALEALVGKESAPFAYLGAPKRVAEGVRFSHFANLAYRIVRKLRSDLPVILNGWGGDHWMKFSDFYIGLDKTMPKDVIFAAQDNIDSLAAPTVAGAYGQLSPERQRWPIPWWKMDDGRDIWNPQANAHSFPALCRDCLEKKCQGMMGIYWGARLVEEAAGYQARFAWNPSLTYEQFYDDFASKSFGRPWAKPMSQILRDLEALGPHWTGTKGLVSCGDFAWFAPNGLPRKENLQKLATIRSQLVAFRQEMLAERRLEGLERLEWLLTTLDWLVRFDEAAYELHADGPVEKLLKEAEDAKAKGDAALAREKAQAAHKAILKSGFREALQTYPKKMGLVDEFGDFVNIQTKAYGAYRELYGRAKKILGDLPPDDLGGPPVPEGTPPLIVGRQPQSALEAGKPFSVNAVVVGGEHVTSCVLHYRRLGDRRWRAIPMANSFRRTWAAAIPAAAIEEKALGVEWFVEATDRSKRVAYWPKGYPCVTWSASIGP